MPSALLAALEAVCRTLPGTGPWQGRPVEVPGHEVAEEAAAEARRGGCQDPPRLEAYRAEHLAPPPPGMVLVIEDKDRARA
eukprot:6572659-Alexandrium_andersonii.AAC.1